jgi:hypothetical protein
VKVRLLLLQQTFSDIEYVIYHHCKMTKQAAVPSSLDGGVTR